jgi:hypothetical protein
LELQCLVPSGTLMIDLCLLYLHNHHSLPTNNIIIVFKNYSILLLDFVQHTYHNIPTSSQKGQQISHKVRNKKYPLFSFALTVRWRSLHFQTNVRTIELVLIDPQSVGKRTHALMDTVNAKKR